VDVAVNLDVDGDGDVDMAENREQYRPIPVAC
jgi:hypothetical protein